jgi:aldose 1-epimerase
MLTIASREYEVGLDPEDGGGVTFVRHRGVDVLRPAPAVRKGPLDLSCFALVPYANRIAHGRFVWEGREVLLAPNMAGDPSPLHGDGWLSAWSVVETAADRIVLELRHPAGGWPWSYLARLVVHADDRGVSIELELTNLSDQAMPAGLGFHPYFPGRAAAGLQAKVQAVWLTDSQLLPTVLAAPNTFGDWAAGAALASPGLIDNCHTGWSGVAEITLADRGLQVRLSASSSLHWLQVFSPPGQDFFAVEPVSHRPDALNTEDPIGEGVMLLPPGAAHAVGMRIEVV